MCIDFKKFKENFLYHNELILKFIQELIYKNQQLQCIINRELVFDATSKVSFMLINDLEMFNQLKRKVSSAVNYSQNALEQSKLASDKLASLTNEFDTIINEIENKSELMKQIDKSEDIVIESNEELLKSTKKLQMLKTELDKLLQNCKAPEEKV